MLLVDDHNLVRNGIKTLLEKNGKFQVIGEASNADEAFELLEQGLSPEIILADITVQAMTGIMLAKRFIGAQNAPKIVLHTISENNEFLALAFKAGAMGYLLKSIGAEELVFALSHIYYQKKKYISADVAVRLVDHISDLSKLVIENGDGKIAFSKRETEILGLIAEGFSNQEIADKLFTSKRTVEGHRQAMMDKANVRNSAALVRYAFQNKLLG